VCSGVNDTLQKSEALMLNPIAQARWAVLIVASHEVTATVRPIAQTRQFAAFSKHGNIRVDAPLPPGNECPNVPFV
jgi:hypothetical protein